MRKVLMCLILTLATLLLLAYPSEAIGQEYHWYFKRAEKGGIPTTDEAYSKVLGHACYYYNPKTKADEKRMYLTFDVGYENGNVAKILDILKEEQVQGAFFLLSHVIKSHPALIERMEKEGHLLCNHTSTHPNMAKKTEEEFQKELTALEDVYTKTTGKSISRFYRPPEGKFSFENIETAEKMGYTTIFWSVAYADWDDKAAPSDEKAMKLLDDRAHNGAIILLHPTSNINARILKNVIRKWKAEGYVFGNLEELKA